MTKQEIDIEVFYIGLCTTTKGLRLHEDKTTRLLKGSSSTRPLPPHETLPSYKQRHQKMD